MLKLIIHGHLTKAPVSRVSPKGTTFTDFSVASNRQYKNDRGETVQSVDYVDVKSHGKQAEVIAKHFKSGQEFFGVANLRQEKWKDGETQEPRSKLVAALQEFEFCGKKVANTPAEDDEAHTEEEPAEAVAGGR